ncbi:MAG: CDP-glycerol glycerophosphotransferase family protein [Methanobrevibacter sp.]|nr:CDP-glycerol glycerophosphotransferase family protein [Methanobrevibacter sp.]MBO7714146.1 CDP-glycerol glycerophosphotransferase family protein [Methanobrevibacter sp.]
MDEVNSIDYKEYELEEGFSVRKSKEYNALFKNGKPNVVLKANQNVYNRIFDFQPKALSIFMKEDKVIIEFAVLSKKFQNYDLSKYHVNLGYNNYEFTKKSENKYLVEIPYNSINISGRSAGVYIEYIDENGFSYKKKFLSMKSIYKRGKNKLLKKFGIYDEHRDHDLYYSDLIYFENHSIFLYETWKGFLSLAYREINVTDDIGEQKKIKSAYKEYMADLKKGKNTPSILLYEKFCGKYEESAKYVYERLIDDGWENVYFILSKDSEFQKEVPEKYRKNLIEKYSKKHYYEYFNAKAFITTESINHVIDLTTYNALTRKRQYWKDYYYIFLQHGVMYAYSLKGRWDFEKGGGFGDNSYVVVSSETEANHFIEDGNFDRQDLIKCGLPKFDHSIQNDDADKILIMPTSRNFEYSTIRDDTLNSTYYNFSKNIIESVPDDLKDKIVFIPHPLVNAIFGETDLDKYMPTEYSYDELLKNTRLLITDYSSISYDAFYRGANVIFAWMEKEMCLENLGIDLKLNDDNAFADIAYDYESLHELISKNYYGNHSEENIEKYNDIVEFHDGENTERFIEYVYDTNIFSERAGKHDIDTALVEGIEDRPYTGKSLGIPKIKVSYDGKKLIKGLDFEVKYHDNVSIGTAKCEIKGLGIYHGTKVVNFEIKKNMKKTKAKLDGDHLTVKDGDKTLIEGEDYSIEKIDYSVVGLEKIAINGMGEYTGQKGMLIDISKKLS